MAITPFTVLTEFKFEVGSAIASASGLQGAVDKLSSSAEDLQLQLAHVGVGFAAQFGLVGGGLIGLLGNALRQFDDIEQQQIKLGGIMFANRGFLSGVNSANDALEQSSVFLRQISQQAQEFGLNEKALAQFASLGLGITAKEGIGPGKNIEFGRNILKAAPQLGIDAFEAQGQITRALLGGASTGDPAFRAVAAETIVFKEFAKKIGGVNKVAEQFNKLPLAERFNMLNNAFGQFTSNAALLAAQADTISNRLLIIKQSLFGLDGALKPIGAVLSGPTKEALQAFITLIKTSFRTTVGDIANVFKQLIPNLETLIIRLRELSDVAGNFKAAGIGSIFLMLAPILLRFIPLGRIFISVSGVIGRGVGQLVTNLPSIGAGLSFIGKALLAFAKPVALLFGLFSLFSRANAMANIEDAKKLPAIMARFSTSLTELVALFNLLMRPFNAVFDAVARFISGFFEISFWIDVGVTLFEKFTTVLIDFFGILSGVINAVLVPAMDLMSGNFSGAVKGLTSEQLQKNFQEGRETLFDAIMRAAGQKPGGDLATSGQTVNIGKVDINNQFKEQMEPDRIAFTLVEQLKKVGQNPVQSANRSLGAALVGK